MKIEVLGMQDMDDGSSLMTVDMDREMLVAMAKIGLLRTLTDAADRVNDDPATESEVADAERVFLNQMAKDLEELSVRTYALRERYHNGEMFLDHQIRDLQDSEKTVHAMQEVLCYYRGYNWRSNIKQDK